MTHCQVIFSSFRKLHSRSKVSCNRNIFVLLFNFNASSSNRTGIITAYKAVAIPLGERGLQAYDRNRVCNLRTTKPTLCRLSYVGKYSHFSRARRNRTFDQMFIRHPLSPLSYRPSFNKVWCSYSFHNHSSYQFIERITDHDSVPAVWKTAMLPITPHPHTSE